MAVRYNDTNYYPIPFIYPFTTYTANTVNTGTTPDEMGNRFSLPFPVRVTGMWITPLPGASQEFRLYDAANNVLATVAPDADVAAIGTNIATYLFPSAVDLASFTLYRIVATPQSASSQTVKTLTTDSAAVRVAIPGGGYFQKTHRTDAGSWTDTDTQMALIGLLIEGFSNGASSYGFVG